LPAAWSTPLFWEYCVPAGGWVNAHRHATEEIWHVTEGEATYVHDGEERVIRSGDTVIAYSGTWHGVSAGRGIPALDKPTSAVSIESLGRSGRRHKCVRRSRPGTGSIQHTPTAAATSLVHRRPGQRLEARQASGALSAADL
jgi:hypothetical protein